MIYGASTCLKITKKQTSIESLPPVLVLHLKRFVYNGAGGVVKLSNHIQYNHELLIKPGKTY